MPQETTLLPDITFRKALPQEAPLLAAMNQELIRDEGHRNAMSLAELESRMSVFLNSDYEAVLFLQDEKPVGYALYRHDPEWLYLRQFYVSPNCRRLGIGKTAISWMKQNVWQNRLHIRIDVLVGKKSGLAFWRRAGFQDYCLTMEMENASK